MASWKGAVSFGLVSVPIALEPATEEQKVEMQLHQAHQADGGRVRLKRWCELEDREIQSSEIVKEYEAEDGRTALVTSKDLADMPVPTKKTITVLGFVDQSEIDPVYFGKPYYVSPDKVVAAKPYALLRDAMAETGRVAVTKITLSTKESAAVLRVHDGVMILQLMVWPAEVRAAYGLPDDAGLRPQELAMARSLVDTMTASFEDLATELHDDYQGALRALVQAKLEGAEPPRETLVRVRGDNVLDLMAALEASVKDANARRGSSRPAQKTPVTGSAAASSPAQATTRKRTATTVKKTAAKKASPSRATGSRRRIS